MSRSGKEGKILGYTFNERAMDKDIKFIQKSKSHHLLL
jgi:hypothetical protein